MRKITEPHFISRSRQVIDESLNKKIVSCGVNREKAPTAVGVLGALDETKELFYEDIYASNYILTGAHGLHCKSRLKTDIKMTVAKKDALPVVERIERVLKNKFKMLSSEEYHSMYYTDPE